MAGADNACDAATLRDYFATEALAGLLANSESGPAIEPTAVALNGADRLEAAQWFAERAYMIADAMLQARGK